MATGTGRVALMEHHDGAYKVWRDAGVAGRTLVHIDAHHDLWWADDPDDISIANFIAPALAQDLVREVIWVVPDPTWHSRRGQSAVRRHLRRLGRGYPGHSGPIRRERDCMTTTLLDRRVSVCPLAAVRPPAESVLLDIDVDYLVIPRVSPGGRRDRHGALPWCWPDELAQRIAAAGLRADITTIAYSVHGGYTPLRWKYLGDELRDRLEAPAGGSAAIPGWDLMKEAALGAARGDTRGARRSLAEAERLLPGSAAPAFALALLEPAGGHYQRAVALDASYRTPYVNDGFRALWDGDLSRADAAFGEVLALDPGNPYGTLGQSSVAARRRRWAESMQGLGTALAHDETTVDAHRVLGEALAGAGRVDDGIAAFERSLRLTLSGKTPIDRLIATDPAAGLTDPGHCAVHARLARLYASRGNRRRAIDGYRIAMAGGVDGAGVRAGLAWCCARSGDWWGALRALTAAATRTGRRESRRGPPPAWRAAAGTTTASSGHGSPPRT